MKQTQKQHVTGKRTFKKEGRVFCKCSCGFTHPVEPDGTICFGNGLDEAGHIRPLQSDHRDQLYLMSTPKPYEY
ncbi:MAG: hypothetical protein WCV50_00740 [Patescibacteria group bacterium]